MMSPSSEIEPIRVANRLLGRPAFEWSTSSIDGRASIASNGLPLAAERIEDVISRTDAMILCGGTRLPEADEGPARDVLEKGLKFGMGGQHLFGRNRGHYLRDMTGPVILKQHEVESRNAAIDEKDQPHLDLSVAQRLIDQPRTHAGNGPARELAAICILHRHQPVLASVEFGIAAQGDVHARVDCRSQIAGGAQAEPLGRFAAHRCRSPLNCPTMRGVGRIKFTQLRISSRGTLASRDSSQGPARYIFSKDRSVATRSPHG